MLRASHSLLALFMFLVACNADPNVISDDDGSGSPILPAIPLECDSLPVPNSVFPRAVGEVLVFADSGALRFDTLLCVKNEARVEPLDSGSGIGFCAEYYAAAYATNWLAEPEVYSIAFYATKTMLNRHEVVSVPQEDFRAHLTVQPGVPNASQLDSMIINGQVFHDLLLFPCQSEQPCAFVTAFASSTSLGLVAYERGGKWWTIQ